MKLPSSLNLHVPGRLSEADARRQQRSAEIILERFESQPGVILGDEVGMGKTFVALAVVAAHVVADPSRPVVVMVPGSVVKKWENDCRTFRSACLRSESERQYFRVRVAATGIEFLKLLDDPEEVRASVIILAHGALNRRLGDRWAKLAVLQAAIKGRHGVDDLRCRIARYAARVLRMGKDVDEDLVIELLRLDAMKWKQVLVMHGLVESQADDPVPELFIRTLRSLDLSDVYRRVVETLPIRSSKAMDERLRSAANAMNNAGTGVLPPVWRKVLAKMDLSLPLLVLDEAHRTRNAGTQLSHLLRERDEDQETIRGPLAQRFDRMLFLTATPFQLGHHELCNVLSRFEAIAWQGRRTLPVDKTQFTETLRCLQAKLNSMQVATERLEREWKRLLAPDLEDACAFGTRWWALAKEGADPSCMHVENGRLRAVMLAFETAHAAIRDAEAQLQPWVLRSARSRLLPPPHADVVRRERIEGASVLADANLGDDSSGGGLKVGAHNALPFLLAARINSFGSRGRVFGEGLASSYEALLDTRKEPDASESGIESNEEVSSSWHLAKLRDCVASIGSSGRSLHPKVHATVELAMSLWRRGEKVLIFCHYRHTGRSLHRILSERMLEETRRQAAEKLHCADDEVEKRLKRFIDRLDRDRAGAAIELMKPMLKAHPRLDSSTHKIEDVVLRFLRTPEFLARFANFDTDISSEGWMQSLFDSCDESGLCFREILKGFLAFLADRMDGEDESDGSVGDSYLAALEKIQTGTHSGSEGDGTNGGEDDETPDGDRVLFAANVRRIYGDTRPEIRERILLTFNTPFFPEILIASSVMAEGVDLHLNCRHVIHHDLDWNPSALEQRTGRIDRLGCKAERAGRPIRVYLPYVEGCQDEKLFRVVMDRERWFGVVMGADESMKRVLGAGAHELDEMAEQPLVPTEMVEALKLSLDAVQLTHVIP